MYAILCETKDKPLRDIYLHGIKSLDAANELMIDLAKFVANDPNIGYYELTNFNMMLTYYDQGDFWSFKVVEEELVGI